MPSPHPTTRTPLPLSPTTPPPPPPPALTPDAFHSYHFSEVWGGTDDEALRKMDAFFESTHFEGVAPLSDAVRHLTALTPHFRFVCVTSRQHVLEGRTRAWLARHFPGVFDDVVFGNHYGKDGPKLCVCVVCGGGSRNRHEDTGPQACRVCGGEA